MKIGVVGLGLIGGSIFKALEALNYDVIGVSDSQNGLQENISNDFNNLKDCEMVFVATPMNKTLDVLQKLEEYLPESTIVADTSSLKEFVSNKNYKYNFIPTHPMAGTEFKGFEHSFKELFEGAKWVVCNRGLAQEKNNSLAELIFVIEQMGAEVVFADAKEHDEAVAMISHMPMVVAQALFKTIADNKLALKLASSGFRDMTRLALSNEEMAVDMVNMNHKNIEQAILKFYSSVGDLIGKNYANEISDIKTKRQNMYNKEGKNRI